MAQSFDLTPSMAPFFDVHMVAPLLDFLREVELYDPRVITKQKIKAILKTNLIDLVEEEYNRYPDDKDFTDEFNALKNQLESRRDQLFDRIDNEPADVVLVKTFFLNNPIPDDPKNSTPITLELLSNTHGISAEALDNYYRFGKFKYECGMYDDAEKMLGNFLSIVQPSSSSVVGARWGRLACRILGAKWDQALQDLAAVKEAIEVRHISPVDQLRQRAWLLHWALFVHINQRDGVDALADFFTEKHYLQTVENLCPWLLRYYTAFVVLSPTRRKNMLRDVLNEIQAMSYLYSDPMTEFLSSLYVMFDFEAAQQKLQECQKLMKTDFFLQIYADKFTHEARILICEMYCTLNKRVDLVMLSQQLQLSEEETERWMVEMVSSTSSGGPTGGLDAKIDASANQVIMAPPARVSHQAVVDKTRDLTGRTAVLGNTLSTLLQEQMAFIQARVAPAL